MIQRLVRNKEPVMAVLSDAQHKHQLALMSDADWKKLRVLQMVLDPCRYAMELLGGEHYVSCSVVLPALCHLQHVMTVSDEDPAYIVRFKTAFISDLSNRQQSMNMTWLRIATALDPRYKNLKCLPKQDRESVWSELHQVAAQVELSIGPHSHTSSSSQEHGKDCHLSFVDCAAVFF